MFRNLVYNQPDHQSAHATMSKKTRNVDTKLGSKQNIRKIGAQKCTQLHILYLY